MKNKNELNKFLKRYPKPFIRTAAIIKDGFICCIKPIPTICGPELHVNPSTKQELINFMREK